MTVGAAWERTQCESAPAFEAFQTYLRQGAGRSVTKVADECHKSRSLIGRWSRLHEWVERARLYDADLASSYRAEVVDAQRSLAHRHLAVAQSALRKVSAAVDALDVADLNAGQLVRLWETAARTERDALALALPAASRSASRSDAQSSGVLLSDEERHARLQALHAEVARRLQEVEPGSEPGETDQPWNPDLPH